MNDIQKEKQRIRKRLYYIKNKEYIDKRNKKWRDSHKEYCSEYQTKWRLENMKKCEKCGKPIAVNSRYCASCSHKGINKGENNPNWGKLGKESFHWKGGKYQHKSSGYILTYVDKHKYEPEHRVIMETHIGRALKPEEIIHHKNGVKDDNRLENLEIVLKKTHMGEVRCPYCLKMFKIK